MKYIISEDELKECIDIISGDGYYDVHTKNLLKNLISKQLVQEIASGQVTQDLSWVNIWFIKGKQINSMFKKYKGQLISIYIERKDNSCLFTVK